MQLNFHNALQCWEISLAKVQENRSTEPIFKVLQFPEDKAKEGLDPRDRKSPVRTLHSRCINTKDERVFSPKLLLRAISLKKRPLESALYSNVGVYFLEPS